VRRNRFLTWVDANDAWERFRQPDGNWPFFVRAALLDKKPQQEEQVRRGESAEAVEARTEETKMYRVLVVYQENLLRKSILRPLCMTL
jgi:hypothetical protein